VEDLTETHEQCDLAYLIKDNRQFIMLLHDVVYPKGSKLTKATTKLQSLFDGVLMSLWSRRFFKAHVMVMRTTGANKSCLSLQSLS
jgi:hypothetical protein